MKTKTPLSLKKESSTPIRAPKRPRGRRNTDGTEYTNRAIRTWYAHLEPFLSASYFLDFVLILSRKAPLFQREKTTGKSWKEKNKNKGNTTGSKGYQVCMHAPAAGIKRHCCLVINCPPLLVHQNIVPSHCRERSPCCSAAAKHTAWGTYIIAQPASG